MNLKREEDAFILSTGKTNPTYRVAKRRKLLNEDLGAQGSRNAQPVQTNEAVKFCADMLAHPTEYTSVITRSQHSLVLCMTFAALSHHTYEQLWAHVDATQARPKPALTPLLNIYPWMRFLPNWIPGCNFYEIGEKYHQTDKALWTGVISDVREGLVSQALIGHFRIAIAEVTV